MRLAWSGHVDENLEAQLVKWRRHLHSNPELSFEEHETTSLVCRLLEGWRIPHSRPLETGVVGWVRGDSPGSTVAVRCDLDALPIEEETEREYASVHRGRMHACGHDGHTAILLGLARVLSEIRGQVRGEIRLVFQPAEEVGEGASRLIEQGILEGVDAIIGLHLESGVETGRIALRSGPVMAAADFFEITMNGRGGHGGLPHQAIDPLVIASSLVGEIQTLVSRRIDPVEPAVVTVGSFHAGSAPNVIPDQARLRGTVRTFSEPIREQIDRELRHLAMHHARAHGAEVEVSYTYGPPPLVNHRELVEFLEPAVAATVGREGALELAPMMAAEDFAAYTQTVPGAFAFVGSGNAALGTDYPHHHPRFDLDERALGIGLSYFLECLERFSSGSEEPLEGWPRSSGSPPRAWVRP